MDVLRSLLYLTTLYGAWRAGSFRLERQSGPAAPSSKSARFTRRLPRATLLLTLVIALPTTLQFFFPSILTSWRRDTGAFLAGDWWRVVTPLFVQDGGVVGSLFNLLALFFVGGVAERLWGSTRWLIIFIIGGMAGEVVSLTWEPVGAGNSLANFALAGSICLLCLGSSPIRLERMAACVSLGAGLLLLPLHDHHGWAVVAGSLIAVALIRFDRGGRDKSKATSDPQSEADRSLSGPAIDDRPSP